MAISLHETLSFDAPESNNNGCTFFHEDHPSSPKIRVFFNFKCRCLFKLWLAIPNSPPLIFQHRDQITLPMMETYLLMTDEDLSHDLQAQSFINYYLLHWPIVAARNRKKLTSFAVQKAREVLQSMPGEFNDVKIDIPVMVSKNYTFWQIMGEDEIRMHPAAEQAMDELLKGTMVMEKMNCVVCLEEMESGSEGKEMPCSHVFHEDCITRWLRTSHYCPVCRFELPIA